jgi:2'-5' RNA ligase
MTWLIPAAGPVRDQLATTIGRIAAEQGTPVFEPHVTLAPRTDCEPGEAVRALTPVASQAATLDISLSAVGQEQVYFRSLFLRADPSAQLTQLHESARQALRLAEAPYMPHLSLLYSDLTDEQKQPIAAGLDLVLPLTIQIRAIQLWASHPSGVTGWTRVCELPLPGHG